MNKNEFVNLYSENTGKTKKDAGIEVEAFLETLKESLIKDGKISFMDNWTMEIIPTKERQGVNPATGEKIKIPAGKKIRFKASKVLKSLING